MKNVFLVGGAPRDLLMGVTPTDYDFVVVGSTPQEMLDKGFKQVGESFPVFLHPVTGHEYALARTETKAGKGYNGFNVDFNPSITLEQDLFRRDCTINAMAIPVTILNDQGEFKIHEDQLIDPFNGKKDIQNKILQHVSFHFKEDPLRVLRVARFHARFPNFTIDKDTLQLMKNLVKDNEMEALTPERIWLEFEKAFKEKNIGNFFHLLYTCGALERLSPELHSNYNQLMVACSGLVNKAETDKERMYFVMSAGLKLHQIVPVLNKFKVDTHTINHIKLQKLLSSFDRDNLDKHEPEEFLSVVNFIKRQFSQYSFANWLVHDAITPSNIGYVIEKGINCSPSQDEVYTYAGFKVEGKDYGLIKDKLVLAVITNAIKFNPY